MDIKATHNKNGLTNQYLRVIFHDAGARVLAIMLENPEKTWTVRELGKQAEVGHTRAAHVAYALEHLGWATRNGRGRSGGTRLHDTQALLDAWPHYYDFSMNKTLSFYDPKERRWPQIKSVLKKISAGHLLQYHFGLTMDTAANLMLSFTTATEEHYIYFKYAGFDTITAALEPLINALGLKELKSGGNLHFVLPYYKQSVFFDPHGRSDSMMTSALHVYLDLVSFPGRRREHAVKIREHYLTADSKQQ